MARFGGYAQQFFRVNPDDLASSGYDTSLNGYDILDNYTAQELTVTDTGILGISYSSQKMNLDSESDFVTYFTLDGSHDLSEYTFAYTYIQNYKEYTGTLTPTLEVTQEHGTRAKVRISNVPVAYWDYLYEIRVTDPTGNVLTVTSSVLAWAKRCIESDKAGEAEKNMAKAMFFYNQAANEYFGK